MLASTQAREAAAAQPTPRPRTASPTCRSSCAASPPTSRRRARRRRARSRSRRSRSRRSSPRARQNPFIRFDRGEKKLHRSRSRSRASSKSYDRQLFKNCQICDRSGRAHRDHRPQRHRQDHADALLAGDLDSRDSRHGQVGREARTSATCRRTRPRNSRPTSTLTDWMAAGRTARRTTTRSCAPRSAACCSRGDESKKSVQGAVGRREGPHDVRQADAAPPQRDADGRADQPHGHGIDRVAATSRSTSTPAR